MTNPKTTMITAIVLATGLPVAASALSIDTFDTQQITADRPFGGLPATSEMAAGEALGGFRDVAAINDGGTTLGTTATVNSGGTRDFNLSNASTASGNGVLTYDGMDDAAARSDVDTDGLAGVDLTDNGLSTMFVFDVISSDSPFEYALTVWDDDSSATAFGSIDAGVRDGRESLDFALFDDINFMQTGAVQLAFSGGPNSDLSIDNFRTAAVPLPAGLPLLVAALGGLAFVRRRKD